MHMIPNLARSNSARIVLCVLMGISQFGCQLDPYEKLGLRPPTKPQPIESRHVNYECVPVNPSYVPVSHPYAEDPRVPLDPNIAPKIELSLYGAVKTAMENSPVIRASSLTETFSRVDGIRTLDTSYDQIISREEIQVALSRFDTQFEAAMFWNKEDVPPGTSFGGIGNRPPMSDRAAFEAELSQLLKTGARVRANFATDYFFIPPPLPGPNPNPQYFSTLQFGIAQPLLRGSGVETVMAPIGIAQAQASQSVWDFKQDVLAMVRSVEQAYWGLYAAQQNLKAIDTALPLYHNVIRVQQERSNVGTGDQSELAQARADLLALQRQRLATLSAIAEQELVLRRLIGMPPKDGNILILTDEPIRAPLVPDYQWTVATALQQRPDILRQRLAVHIANLDALLARDAYRPRLDLEANYGYNGLGDEINDSLDVLFGNRYNDWEVGLTFEMPLQRTAERANLRRSRFEIARETALLEDTSDRAVTEVADALRRMHWLSREYEVSALEVEAIEVWQTGAKARFENPTKDLTLVLALDLYLRNLRSYVDSSIAANETLAGYNNAMARLYEVTGTLLDQRGVIVMGDQSQRAMEKLGPAIDPEQVEPPAALNSGDPRLPDSPDDEDQGRAPIILDYRFSQVRFWTGGGTSSSGLLESSPTVGLTEELSFPHPDDLEARSQPRSPITTAQQLPVQLPSPFTRTTQSAPRATHPSSTLSASKPMEALPQPVSVKPASTQSLGQVVEPASVSANHAVTAPVGPRYATRLSPVRAQWVAERRVEQWAEPKPTGAAPATRVGQQSPVEPVAEPPAATPWIKFRAVPAGNSTSEVPSPEAPIVGRFKIGNGYRTSQTSVLRANW